MRHPVGLGEQLAVLGVAHQLLDPGLGTAGFGDLARDADTVEIDGGGVRVAGLRDLLRIADASPHPDARRQALAYRAVLDVQRARHESKRQADRPKDREYFRQVETQ